MDESVSPPVELARPVSVLAVRSLGPEAQPRRVPLIQVGPEQAPEPLQVEQRAPESGLERRLSASVLPEGPALAEVRLALPPASSARLWPLHLSHPCRP